LFVIGHSPAIITETLVARFIQDGVVPISVEVVTTASGARKLKKCLFEEGGWQAFCTQWEAMKQIKFDEQCIVHPRGIDDIRNETDNLAMTTVILETVKQSVCTADILDASLAGGRKTMGYYLGFAMSLFAREQDSLTHVLVPADIEKDYTFLVPTPKQAKQIVLIDVPFIRLRKHIKSSVAKLDVQQLSVSAQTAVDMAALTPVTLDRRKRQISFLDKVMALPEREFSIYWFFALQKEKHCMESKRSLCDDCTACFLTVDAIDTKKDELLDIRAMFGHSGGHYERFKQAWDEPRAAQYILPEVMRRIDREIEKVYGVQAQAEQVKLRNVGKRGEPLYGLTLDKSQVRMIR